MSKTIHYDHIGYWSEIKLDIVREYATAYSKIMSAQKFPSFYHVYIDAFAGAGVHVSRSSREFVEGSPANALLIDPPFKEYHFIDLDAAKVGSLEELSHGRKDVLVYEGDCNTVLLQEIFPRVSYGNYRRGLCLLDPYGLHLNWDVISTAGSMKSLEIFLNFPVADMNRNVLWRNPEAVDKRQLERMNAFWGDETWRRAAYSVRQYGLFGDTPEKTTNKEIANAFKRRLLEVAGFKFVPDPMPMVNSVNAVVYYLFFASHNQTGKKIVSEVFEKYSTRRFP
jgi:three-Cys-motif partner protein